MTDEDGGLTAFNSSTRTQEDIRGNADAHLQLLRGAGQPVQFHVVEGYATATAVPYMYPDENNIAVVAFSKGQLENVAQLVRDRFGNSTNIVIHHEWENIDLWDVVNIPEKRERYRELLKQYWGEKAA